MKRLFTMLVMLVAINANAQWVSYSLPYTGLANTISFYDLNHGVSFGHTFSTVSEKIFYTTNSGVNWIQAYYPTELRAIVDVQYINANTIYACGAENTSFANYSRLNNDFILYPKFIRDKLKREGIKEFSNYYKGAFIKSTDGGLNWQRGSQFDTSTGYIVDINFFDANTGYSLINANSYAQTKFYKTTNAGANWQLVKQFDTSYVDKMVFFDMNTGIAQGISWQKNIYKTTNAGVNWDVTNMSSMISCITFFNSTTGIAIGFSEPDTTNIYKTTNTGGNWNLISTFKGYKSYNNLMSLPNTGTAFAIGNIIDTAIQWIDKITTLKTTNYGLNWVSKDFNPKLLAYGLSLVDANNFFIGAGMTNLAAQILKSTNGGNVFVNQIGTTMPSKYSLSQNYPNPFNPITNIKFSIVNAGEVKLVVYDIQGREVLTLVNESLKPGTYEAAFDGSALNNGVYFYKLVTGNFTETKKMLYIK